MSSIHFGVEAGPLTQGVNDFANSITGASDLTFGAWIRERSYAVDFASVFSFNGPPGHSSLLGVDCNETAPGDLNIVLFDGAGTTGTITTGSFTGWIAVAIRHVGGSNNYDVLARLEGETSMTLVTTLSIGSEADLGWLRIGNDDFGDPANCDVRAFFANQAAMSDGDIFDLFQNYATFDGTAFKVFLPLTSAATVLHNDGTGGDWTRQDGTPTTEASQPDTVHDAHVVQTALANDVTTDTTISVTLYGVAPGSAIHVWSQNDDGGGGTPSCASDRGDSFTELDLLHETFHGNFVAQFTCPAAVGGDTVFTITFSATSLFRGVCAMEIRGVGAAYGNVGNVESPPGLGTDDLTSGPTTATGPSVLVAIGFHDTGSYLPPFAGTSFSTKAIGWFSPTGAGVTAESAVVDAGSVAATFTARTAATHVVLAALYPVQGAVATVANLLPSSPIFFGMNS